MYYRNTTCNMPFCLPVIRSPLCFRHILNLHIHMNYHYSLKLVFLKSPIIKDYDVIMIMNFVV